MRTTLALLFLLVIVPPCLAQYNAQQAYIERYKDIAILEMDRTGIPASIKLAQGLLESAAGESFLARRANNHFGIKCGSSWDGKKMFREDDDYDEHGELQKSCFRVYRDAEDSYIAHSEFLRDPYKEYRYGFLFRIDPTDYQSWARGLKKSGYATSATYDRKLIAIIERYELYRYDQYSSPDILPDLNPTTKEEEILAGITFNNDVKVIVVEEGDTPASVAERAGIPLSKLRKNNEQLPGRDTKLKAGTLVYLESKRNSYRGDRKWHYVQDGESMYEISQMYGIKLNKLYSRNMMPMGSEPAPGERVRLRGKTRKMEERPVLAREAPPVDPSDQEELDFEDDFWSPEIPIRDGEVSDEEEELQDDFLDEVEPIPGNDEIDPIVSDTETEPDIPELPETTEIYHVVIKGDTLYSLSRKYGTTVDTIKSLNGLTSNLITTGQKLRIK